MSTAPKVLAPNLDAAYAQASLQALAPSQAYGIRASDYGHESYLFPAGDSPSRRYFLPDYAVVSITGEDAASFLQGQLTNDVAALRVGDSQLAGFCTAKGRMLASGWLCRESEHRFLWVVSTPLAAPLQKRLGMFVLRAKAKVLWETEVLVLGLSGSSSVASAFTASGITGAFIVLCPVAQAAAQWQQLHGEASDSNAWRLLEIQAGLARVSALTSELFVPQMLNFELVGGVNFKKGCYPGQEVVARSQYLGKLKRRMVRVLSESAVMPSPGDDVWASGEQAEPVGQVVSAALAVDGKTLECLIEAQTSDDPESGQTYHWRKGESDSVFARAELPYVIQKIA